VDSPKSLLANSTPDLIATGVSSGTPTALSPIAKICSAEVYSSLLIKILPHLSILTPALSRLRVPVSISLPIAKRTVS